MKTSSRKNNFFVVATPLFLILFIDSMGLGLVFPILNALIVDPANSILSLDTSAQTRSFIFSVIISIFMFCWFFGAAFLGDISDFIGRKKSLMICLVGAFLGYLLSAFAVVFSNLTLLIIGRVIAGLTAGSQAIAQAAIVDISTPETKTRNISFILFASSLGFIAGPLIGGFLSDSTLISWFSFSTPLYFTAGISLLNAILLHWLFHETFSKTSKAKVKLHRAIEIFISAFKHTSVGRLSLIFLVMMIGWGNYYTFISMFLLDQYHFAPAQIAIFMSLMAIGFGIGCSMLVSVCTKRFTLKNSVMVGAAVTGICALVTVGGNEAKYAWLTVIPIGMAMAAAYSMILTIFSNQVDETKQGWVMGITGSIMAFAFGATALLFGMLAEISVRIPIIVAGMALLLSAMLLIFYRSHVLSTPVKSH